MKANFPMISIETRKAEKSGRKILKLYHIKDQNLAWWGFGGNFILLGSQSIQIEENPYGVLQ